MATAAATHNGRRYITATMKKVSAAKETRNPASLSAATDAASAAQALNARPAPDQLILSPSFSFRLEAMRKSDRAAIAMPYQSGKKPGPGPSAPRYSQRDAAKTM